jgi:hypothetical protein
MAVNSTSSTSLPSLAINKSSITGVTTANGSIITATYDSGLYALADQQVWQKSGDGIPKDVHLVKGSFPENFVLLSPGANGFTVGSTWDAGILHTDSTEIHLTAKIVEYFDKLSIDSTLSYSNLFAVNYSASGSNALSAPNWTVYYAKGQGPVYISENKNGALISKTYRSK